MDAPLHAPDALRDLAGGPPGAARDWALVGLAQRGLPVPGLPDDPDAARIALAGGAPIAPALDRIRAARAADWPIVAGLVEDLGAYGRLPEDPGPWLEPLRRGIQGRGRPSDLRLAAVLGALGPLGPAELQAASAVEDPAWTWLLPGVVLRFAATGGRDVEAAAAGVAQAVAGRAAAQPGLVGRVLRSLGAPAADPDRPLTSLEEALTVGGTLAGVDETPPVSPGRGSARLRLRAAVRELLVGAPPGPATSLVRALAAAELPAADAGLLVVAAVWLRCAPRADALEAVLGHGAGEDPVLLSAAVRRAAEVDPAALGLAVMTRWHADPPAAALVGPVLARCPDPDLAKGVVDHGAAAVSQPRLQTACALALPRTDAVPRWFASGATAFALYHARHVATEAVLEHLLGLEAPAEPLHRAWYAAALASMGDRGAATALARLVAAHPGEAALAAEHARARVILGDGP